jgi:PKD repeat protein
MPSSGPAPGADDNASGSAAVMLAAKIMKDYAFGRTIRFVFFTGEEQGLLGSDAYAEKMDTENANIVAVLNMDMIGWDQQGGPVLRLHTRTASNPGYAADKAIADQFIAVVSGYGLSGLLTPVIDPDGISASDHYSFWVQGFPGILAIEDDADDFNAYYHTASDKLDKLNLAYFTNFVKAALGTAAHLSLPVHDGVHAGFSYVTDLLKASFTDKSTCTNCTLTDWQWDFGDGGSSTEKNPVHTYAVDGSYTVKLTVKNAANETHTVSKVVKAGNVLEYCAAKGTSFKYEWVAGVTLGGFSKTSGAAGYSDFTAETVSLKKGETASVKLKPGFSGSSYTEYWRIWADLNRDGDFEDAGEKLFEGSGTGEVSGSLTIPATAAAGLTRLRVAMSDGSYKTPCGGFAAGEVEDYTLNVQ